MILPPDLSALPHERGPVQLLACPQCHQSGGSDVVDTRATADVVRRRRVCRRCHARFTTYERTVVGTNTRHDRAKGLAAHLREIAAALEGWE